MICAVQTHNQEKSKELAEVVTQKTQSVVEEFKARPKQLLLDVRLKDSATFSNYLGTAKNMLISQLSGEKDDSWFNGLWFTYVWGEAGSGRSHLLQAACRHAQTQGMRPVYFSVDASENTSALHNLDQLDLVCLDNLDAVAGNGQWEETLLHLVNSLKSSRRRLVVSSKFSPAKIAIKLPDLKSRLLTAIPVETDQLRDEQKLEVLRDRASVRGFELTEDSGQFILRRSRRELSQLLDVLERLDTQSMVQQKKLTIPFIKKVLEL